MMKNKIKYNYIGLFLFSLVFLSLNGCFPDDFSGGNGLSNPNVDASFEISAIDGSANRFLLESNTADVIGSKWDIGEGVFVGNMNEEIFLPDMGTYPITHIAIGKGGETSSATQELVVATSDPAAGNLVQGGKFEDANDHAKWTILNISASGAEWIFNDGSATIFSTEAWAQQGIYQTIEVVKDKEYSIDMLVSGGSFVNTWFEVFAGFSFPEPGVDYLDNKIMGLSTWDGCATEPFSGRLSSVGCVKNVNTESITNTVTFSESGTIYLVIRSGGENYDPGGITISNVEMRGS